MTIAAVATPPGEGAIAIVRVSGPGARGVARRVLRRAGGAPVPLSPRSVVRAFAVDPRNERTLDEVLVLWMPGPASYTREDVLEIQCHGGHAAARAVLRACLDAGARPARPGEFTLRAFLNGRLDLVQAEAVLDVVRARSAEALRVHEELLSGHLSREVGAWQESLTRHLALLEAHLDFPDEEDVGELDSGALIAGLEAVTRQMEEKLAGYAWGRALREGFTAALVGSPNTGKSSLLNRMLGEDRAIVTEAPGTTRDLVEGWTQAEGVPLRIVDTAGLREPGDPAEREGVRRARGAMEQAHCVLLVCDGSRPLTPDEVLRARELRGRPGLVPVLNKVDLGRVPREDLARACGREPVEVSALTGEGVQALLDLLGRMAQDGRGPGSEAPLTRERHRELVAEATGCLREAVEVLRSGAYPEVAASQVHAARRCLAELLGWGAPEDVLEAIFSQFCIGK